MSNIYHDEYVGHNVHALSANPDDVVTGYVDLAARDVDTDWNTNPDNINKAVRVASPSSLWVLFSVDPTVFKSAAGGDTLLDLTDVVNAYAAAGSVAQVNPTGNGLEFGQNLTVTGDPTFQTVTVTTINVGASSPFSDAAGVLILQNVDAIDDTTESTLEAAIDSLVNLTVVGILGAGSIGPGFGDINNGTSSITTTGQVNTGDLIVGGALTVNGTTTTINSTTLEVDDKNIELGTVDTPTDLTADGGGITLKGDTDKRFFWDNATDAWIVNQNFTVQGNLEVTGTIDGVDVGVSVPLNTTHRNSDGSDHSFLDQAVTLASTPSFVGLAVGVSAPDASALVDMRSTIKGLLPPGGTQAERDLIAAPAAGLEFYNTTTNKPNFFDGSAWKEVGATSVFQIATNLVTLVNSSALVGLGISPSLGRLHVKQLSNTATDGIAIESTIGLSGRVYYTNNASVSLQEGTNDNQLELLGDGNVSIANRLQIKGGTPGVGKHLISDANGLGAWATPAAGVLDYNPLATYGLGNMVSIFDIPFVNKVAVAIPETFDPTKWTCLIRGLRTGVISGGANIEIDGIDPTLINVTGVIQCIKVDVSPVNYQVEPFEMQSVAGVLNAHLLTGGDPKRTTHFYIQDSGAGTGQVNDGVLVQSKTNRYQEMIDGAYISLSENDINNMIIAPIAAYSGNYATLKTYQGLGGQALDAYTFANGTLPGRLSMVKEGDIYGNGVNYVNDPTKPDTAAIPIQADFSFRRSYEISGVLNIESASSLVVDPENYNPGEATFDPVPTGKITIQRLYVSGAGQLHVLQYGRTLYDTLDEAKQKYDTSDSFAENSDLRNVSAFAGWIFVQQGVATPIHIINACQTTQTIGRGRPSGVLSITPSQLQSSLAGKSTGLFSGGELSGTAGQTTFDIAAGSGQVIDNTTPGTTTEDQYEWTAFLAVSLTELVTAKHTYVFLQRVGTVVSVIQIGDDSSITEIDRKNKLYLGVIRHGNGTFVGAISQPQSIVSPVNKLIDFYIATGKVRLSSGNDITATGAGLLTLDKGLGKSYGIGVNDFADGNNTDFVDNPALVAMSMLKYSSVGHIDGVSISNVDTSRYDPNGATMDSELVSLTGGATRVAHRVWIEAVSNLVIFQYGQASYATEDDAIAQWRQEDLSLPTGLNESSYLKQVVIVQNGVANLDAAVFVPVEGVGGSGGQIQPVNVIDTLVSTDPNSALSANQGRLLRLADVASGSVVGNDVVLVKNDTTTITVVNAGLNTNISNANQILTGARTFNLLNHPMTTTTTAGAPLIFHEPSVRWFVSFLANIVEVNNDGVGLKFNAVSDLRLDEQPGVDGQVITSKGPDLPPEWSTPVVTSAASNMQISSLVFDDQDGDPSVGVLRVHGANLDSAVFTADFGVVGAATLSNDNKLATMVFTPAVLQTQVILTATKAQEIINTDAAIGVLAGFQTTDATEDPDTTDTTIYGSGFTISTTVVPSEGSVGAIAVAGDGRSLTFPYTRAVPTSEFVEFTVTESAADIDVIAQLEAQEVLNFEIASAIFYRDELLTVGQWWLRLGGVNFGAGTSNNIQIVGGTNGGGNNGTLITSGIGLLDTTDGKYREVVARYDIGPDQRWVMFDVTVLDKKVRISLEVPEEPPGANISTVHFNQDLGLLTVYGDNFSGVDSLVPLGGTVEGSLNIAADFMSLSITYVPFAATGVDVITLIRNGIDTKFHVTFKDFVVQGAWVDMSSEPLPDHSGTGQETTLVGNTHHYDGQGFDDLALWNSIRMDLDNPKSIRFLYSTNQTAGVSSMIGFHKSDSQGPDTTQYNGAQSLVMLYHNGPQLLTAYWGQGSPTNNSISVDGGAGAATVADDLYMLEFAAIGEDFGNKMTIPKGTPQTINPGQEGSWLKVYRVINPAGDLTDPDNYIYERAALILDQQFTTGFISPAVSGDRVMDLHFYMLGDPA